MTFFFQDAPDSGCVSASQESATSQEENLEPESQEEEDTTTSKYFSQFKACSQSSSSGLRSAPSSGNRKVLGMGNRRRPKSTGEGCSQQKNLLHFWGKGN